MTSKKSSSLALATLLMALATALPALAVLAAALPALAHGRGFDRAPARARLAHVLHANGLLGQLIFPCPAACVGEAQSCLQSADATALTCISDSCATEVDAAQSACTTDRSSTECHDAVLALTECGSDCLDTRAAAVSDCRTTQMSCRDACGADQ